MNSINPSVTSGTKLEFDQFAFISTSSGKSSIFDIQKILFQAQPIPVKLIGHCLYWMENQNVSFTMEVFHSLEMPICTVI